MELSCILFRLSPRVFCEGGSGGGSVRLCGLVVAVDVGFDHGLLSPSGHVFHRNLNFSALEWAICGSHRGCYGNRTVAMDWLPRDTNE